MGAQALPLNHPITRHVRRVVSRILRASNLGTLAGEASHETGLAGFGGFDTFGREILHPDVDLGASAHPTETYGPNKEWDVMVVNDRKMVNALAVPGAFWVLFQSFLVRLIVMIRVGRRVHWHFTRVPRRRGPGSCRCSWYGLPLSIAHSHRTLSFNVQ